MILRFACCIVWIVFTACSDTASIPVNLPLPEHGLQYDTPAMVWDEALPLGNGITGARLQESTAFGYSRSDTGN